MPRSRIPLWAFFGGAVGGLGVIGTAALFDRPSPIRSMSAAGHSTPWTAFLVPGFECLILGAALTAFFGMLAGNRLPRLYHPVFNAPSFSLANADRFYLLLRAGDPSFDRGKLRRLLKSLHAVSIEDVSP